ncbi:MAG: 6,7-dimethyl-8-ribityllumazine synthase [Verrucomicrobiota bacterium]
MLKRIRKSSVRGARQASIAIIASRYNARFVDGMLRPARAILTQAGAAVRVVRVPGAFEIPAVAAKLAAAEGKVSALMCLGVILRGETTHAQHIAEAVSGALAQIQVRFAIPVVHEVLLLESEAQAEARCLAADRNRGAEAAYTALAMVRTMAQLDRALRRPGSGRDAA